MLCAVSQVFFFFEDKLRQCQPVSNLHSSFFLPLKYEIIHCVANCWGGGRNTVWNLWNTDLERDRFVEESYDWKQGLILAFFGNAVMNGVWVEGELLMRKVKARVMTCTGAVMVCSELSVINHNFSWIWLVELFAIFSNSTSISEWSCSCPFPPLGQATGTRGKCSSREKKIPFATESIFIFLLQSERPM